MLYVHKFIAGWLLPPGGIIVMLFLLCGYCFKKRSRLRYPLTAVTVTLYLFSFDSSCCRNADAGTGKAVCSSGVGKNNR